LLPVVVLAAAHETSAHVAINILILSPAASARVGQNADAVLLAQRTLDGVVETTFSLTLDGRRVATDERIRVDQRRRIDLGRLSVGGHVLELSYLPDSDALPRRTRVRFETSPDGGTGVLTRGAIAVVLLVLLLAALAFVRRAVFRSDRLGKK
jgi:hypothetical protein